MAGSNRTEDRAPAEAHADSAIDEILRVAPDERGEPA